MGYILDKNDKVLTQAGVIYNPFLVKLIFNE